MLAATLQYVRVEEGGRGRHVVATCLYVLSLLAKPSAAALPLILLALDGMLLKRPIGRSLRLLLPWAVMAIPVMLITRNAEAATGAVPNVPLWARPLIIGDTYAWYLRKLVWPGASAVDYGRSPDVVLHSAAGFAAWLVPVAVGVIVWRMRRRFPAALAGFAVFVAAILPVSGLTCFAFQSISDVADRYVYLAMLGPALALSALLARCRWRPAAGVAAAALGAMSVGSLAAVRHWSDSESLLQHTLAVNPRSWMAWNNLAVLRERKGDIAAAKQCYDEAIRVNPSCFMAHNNLGMILEREGRADEAAAHFEVAVRANPMYAEARFNHGRMLARGGDRLGAAKEFTRAIALDGGYVLAYNNLGAMLTLLGRATDARPCFLKAVEIDPACADARFNLGVNYLQAGRPELAAPQLSEAVRLQPSNEQAKRALADARALTGRQARR
jgi:tetratricopeptide (TPR) repeat protein